MDDICRMYAVCRAELKTYDDGKRTYFECDLEDEAGKKIGFQLMIDGCVGSKDYTEQYKLVEPHFKVGRLIQCATVYYRRTACFSMAMYDFMPMEAINMNTDGVIDADTYFNRNRGFWTRTRCAGERVKLPGLIEFNGDSNIPVIEEGPLPQVGYGYHYDEGLQWGRRPSTLGAIWKFFFGPKPKQAFVN